eukprot:12919714-Prorocentrum_lima.AAC.1
MRDLLSPPSNDNFTMMIHSFETSPRSGVGHVMNSSEALSLQKQLNSMRRIDSRPRGAVLN